MLHRELVEQTLSFLNQQTHHLQHGSIYKTDKIESNRFLITNAFDIITEKVHIHRHLSIDKN